MRYKAKLEEFPDCKGADSQTKMSAIERVWYVALSLLPILVDSCLASLGPTLTQLHLRQALRAGELSFVGHGLLSLLGH